jgi:GTP-binding protein HflX
VHEVLADVGARELPELVVINKIDAAPVDTVERLRRAAPGAIAVSARTGEGIEKLADALAELLPRPEVELEVLLPFRRGDLVNRVHNEGEVLSEEHTGTGTRMRVRVRPPLAAELVPFSAGGVPA